MTRKSKEERLRYIYAKRKERAEQAKLEHSTKVGHLMYSVRSKS